MKYWVMLIGSMIGLTYANTNHIALARVIIVELGPNTYKITNGTFYENSSERDDPDNGYKQNEFYKKYVGFIEKFNPFIKISDFNNCVSNKVSLQYTPKSSSKQIPLHSLQTTLISCHAEQFPNFVLTKVNKDLGDEIIYATQGAESLWIEGAFLATGANIQKTDVKAPEFSFGAGQCLNPSVDTAACTPLRNHCSDPRANCSANYCKKIGKNNHIYLMGSEIGYNSQIIEEFFPEDFVKTYRELMLSGSTNYDDPALINTFCVKCPKGIVSGTDCIDEKTGCSIFTEFYSSEHKTCVNKKCLTTGPDATTHCPETCTQQCLDNEKALSVFIENAKKPMRASPPGLSEVRELDRDRTVKYVTQFLQMDRKKTVPLLKEAAQRFQKHYALQRPLCAKDETKNRCTGAQKYIGDLIEKLYQEKCSPEGKINYHGQCIRANCSECANKVDFIRSRTSFVIDESVEFRRKCGFSLTQSLSGIYYEALENSFVAEYQKCAEDKPFNCSARVELNGSDLFHYASGLGYECE